MVYLPRFQFHQLKSPNKSPKITRLFTIKQTPLKRQKSKNFRLHGNHFALCDSFQDSPRCQPGFQGSKPGGTGGWLVVQFPVLLLGENCGLMVPWCQFLRVDQLGFWV